MLLPEDLAATITNAIGMADGRAFRLRDVHPLSGSFSRNLRLADGERSYFLKLARDADERFAAEADGLAALARCPAFIVPRVVAHGRHGDQSFLILDWLDLCSTGDDGVLGEALADLHEMTSSRFGWRRDNFIGSTLQANAMLDDWPRFFAEHRLRPQLALAARNGAKALATRGEALLSRLPEWLGHAPRPSLLHGDLWRGNVGFVHGRPALFDPAVYAGDGETDLAMAALFGGFSPRFFAAYRARRPAVPGEAARRCLYQLYHVLNHLNLLGGAYAAQAEALIAQLGA